MLKSYLLLHFIIFLFGFTAILREHIQLDSGNLVMLRTFIAALALLPLVLKIKTNFSKKVILQFFGVGLIIMGHWFCFFEAIKVSNVTITLTFLTSGALFVAILDPLLTGKKFLWSEFILGLLIIAALLIIGSESGNDSSNPSQQINLWAGAFYSFAATILAAFFAIINGQYTKKYNPIHISFYELLGASIGAFILLGLQGDLIGFEELLTLDTTSWINLSILALACTAFAFPGSVFVMQKITPFTVTLSINLEPVYGVIIALFLNPEKEQMSFTFYIGAIFILSILVANAIIKKKLKSKPSKT